MNYISSDYIANRDNQALDTYGIIEALDDQSTFENLVHFMQELTRLSNRYGFAVEGIVHRAGPGQYEGQQCRYGVEDLKWTEE